MRDKACDGERTLEDGDFVECLECGTRVRWDLRDDPFWGFQHCAQKTQVQPAAELRARQVKGQT
jgi:hypothetical protein